MSYAPKINDFVKSENYFNNFVERYLHLNGWGRKFMIFAGSVNGTKVSLIEVSDPLNIRKIMGNALRIFSYLIFPLPLIALAIRYSNRKQIKYDLVEDEKYKNLFEETMPEQLIEYAETKTPVDKLHYKLRDLSSDSLHENYEGMKGLLNYYPLLVPKAMEIYVTTLTTTRGIIRGEYEMHLLTLTYLESDDIKGIIPESTRDKLAKKLRDFFAKKFGDCSTEGKGKERKELIKQLLESINPVAVKKIPARFNKNSELVQELLEQRQEEMKKELPFNNKNMEFVWSFGPEFWKKNIETVENVSSSQPIPYELREEVIRNAQTFLEFLKTKTS